MTEAMPFLQNYDITFLRPPTIPQRSFFLVTVYGVWYAVYMNDLA